MNIVILGPQGSGKDTQTEMLAKKFNLERVNMGKFLREVAATSTPLGQEIYHYQNDLGAMVPSRILKAVLGIKAMSYPREQGIIFEGVPRTMDQAGYFNEVVLESGRHIDSVIYINISEAETVKRISRRWMCDGCKKILIKGKDIENENEKCPDCKGDVVQRIDDTPEVIRKRLKVFRDETIPVLEHYKAQGNLLEVDGEQAIEKVFADILDKLEMEK